MNCNHPALQTLLEELNHSDDPLHVAFAHNYLFEERVGEERQRAYESLSGGAATDLANWQNIHKDYLFKKIFIPDGIPETFQPSNKRAQLPPLDDQQEILRLEMLDGALKAEEFDVSGLDEALTQWRNESSEEKRHQAYDLLWEFCDS